MVEIHVVRHDNAHLYGAELDDYFRARHTVYVKERGWTELDRPDGRDIDQFDTIEAIHLLAIDRSRVVGGHRFNPTTGPTLLNTVFPQLAARALAADPDVYETTRIFVVEERRGEQARPRIGEESLLFAATLEYAVSAGMRQIRFLMETWWLPRFGGLGWSVRPLGVATDINGMSCIAVSLDVTDEVWAKTCIRRSVPGPVLVWRGIDRPIYRFPDHIHLVA